RDLGDPTAAFMIRRVVRQPVGVSLLEGERHRDDPPVELPSRYLGGHAERGETFVRSSPGSAVPGEAEPLQDGNIQRGKGPYVPRLVVLTGGRGSRFCAP